MPSEPRYWGTKQGKVVKAIAVDSIHNWRGLQSATGYNEKELNYNLFLLFQDDVLKKSDSHYYLIPSLEEEYWRYFNPEPLLPRKPDRVQNEKIRHSVKVKPRSFIKNEILVMGVIILLVSASTFITLNQASENLSDISSENSLNQNIESTLSEEERPTTPVERNESPTPSEPESSQPQSQPDSSPPLTEPEDSSPPTEPESEETPSVPSEQSEPSSPSPAISSISIERISICTRVIDGDTIEVYNGDRIRLADIDSPDSTESGYESSTDALIARVLNEKVYLDVDGVDNHGRYVCVVYVASSTIYKNVNYALWKGGYADLWDHPNEFTPSTWTMFVSTVDVSHADDDSDDYAPLEPVETPSWALFIGSSQSDKYHKLDCYWAYQILPSNRIYFASESEAESHGYQSCQVCLESAPDDSEPPSWAVYVGSKQSYKYHELNCYWAGQINPENRIYFRSTNDAENSDYDSCRVCIESSDDGESSTPPSPPSETYVGSKNSNKYHKLSCYWAGQINPENRVYFSSKADAESKGYVACKVCKP